MSEFVSEDVYGDNSKGIFNPQFTGFLYSFIFSIYWAPTICLASCWCWRAKLDLVLQIQRQTYLQFHPLIISGSDIYLLPPRPSVFSSFKSVFKWPSFFPQSKLQFLAHGRHSNMRTRGWLHLTVQATQEGWTNPLGLDIRPGEVAWPLCAFHLRVKMESLCTWSGVINIHPHSPTAVSSPTHLHFLFLWLIFLAVKWPESHLTAQERAQRFLFLSKCVPRGKAMQLLPFFLPLSYLFGGPEWVSFFKNIV